MRLRSKIESLGGQPAQRAGAWGAFAKFLEGSAALLGDKPSVDLLEEGEDHGLKAYKDECAKCDNPEVRTFIESELLPGQERTHSTLHALKAKLEETP